MGAGLLSSYGELLHALSGLLQKQLLKLLKLKPCVVEISSKYKTKFWYYTNNININLMLQILTILKSFIN